MKKNVLLLFSLLTISTLVFSQDRIIHGVVLDETGQPLPYAMLGVKEKSIGTITNDIGFFTLKIPNNKYVSTDSLIISFLGYHKHAVLLADLKDSANLFTLINNPQVLAEVVVMPHTSKRKTVGRANAAGMMQTPFFTSREAVDDELGREVGAILELPEGKCRLVDANIYLAPNPYASIKFRLMIYNVNEEGLPHETLLNQDILLDLGYQQTGWNKVDLTPYNLVFDGGTELAVCFQWIKSEFPTDLRLKHIWIGIPCAYPSVGNKVLRRESSQDIWTAIKGSRPSIYLTVDSRK
jgi:hypothetical protein